MKKAIKLLSLVLAVVMCVFCFAACGTEGDSSTVNNSVASSATGSTEENQKSIVVGYTIYEPMNYQDENGKLIGFDTELAEKIFGDLGYKVIFKEIQWENKYTDLNAGTIDCIWKGFTCNTADDDVVMRADKVDFSYNYMENRQAIVVKADSGIAAAADLNGKIGTAEAGSAGEGYAKGFEGAVIKSVTKQTDGLMEVNAGTADFAAVDVQLARSYCGKGDYANLTFVEALSSEVEFYAIGFKKGSDLTAKVNAELEKLGADGTITALAEKYGVENTAIIDFSDQKPFADDEK